MMAFILLVIYLKTMYIGFYLFLVILSKLEIGSLVQFGNPVRYGVIKRIEISLDTSEETAEVETVNMTRSAKTGLMVHNRTLKTHKYTNLIQDRSNICDCLSENQPSSHFQFCHFSAL